MQEWPAISFLRLKTSSLAEKFPSSTQKLDRRHSWKAGLPLMLRLAFQAAIAQSGYRGRPTLATVHCRLGHIDLRGPPKGARPIRRLQAMTAAAPSASTRGPGLPISLGLHAELQNVYG